MINPHQNINININYNLEPGKITRPLPAKKISKIHKAQLLSTGHQADVEIKLNRKSAENNIKKSN